MNRIERFEQSMIAIAAIRNYSLYPLGKTGRSWMWLIHPLRIHNYKPNLLVISGFHGDESGGPWAILNFIKHMTIPAANFSFVPVIFPRAFNIGKKLYPRPNCGFLPDQNGKTDNQSIQSIILKQHGNFLYLLGSNGMLDLHECSNSKGYYLYSFGDIQTKQRMIQAGKKLFNLEPTGTPIYEGQHHILNGDVSEYRDGSIEHFFDFLHCPSVIASEVPKIGTTLHQRIRGHEVLINTFAQSRIETF